MLQEGISDRIFHNDVFTGLRIFERAPWAAINQFRAKFLLSQGITPITESTLGVFHDIAFVDNSQGRLIVIYGVLNRFADQTLSTFTGNWLDTNP